MNEGQGRSHTAAVLVGFPTSALVIAIVLTIASWSDLPPTSVTHWGAGGADGIMPKEWAVGIPLAICVGATGWVLVRATRVRVDARRLYDTAVMCGLFSWIGLAALNASIWSGLHPDRGTAPAVIGGLIAIGLTVAVARYGKKHLRRIYYH